VKLRSAVARINRVYSPGMISMTRVYLMLIMASKLLGGLARADNSTLTFAQNPFGNATDSAKAEGPIVQWQSVMALPCHDLHSNQWKSS